MEESSGGRNVGMVRKVSYQQKHVSQLKLVDHLTLVQRSLDDDDE